MSRGPNKQGIEKLRALAKERAYVAVRLREVEAFLKEKDNLEQQWRDINKDMLKLLEEMDCSSKGNMGWESRITLLLSELVSGGEHDHE